jgi:hypothetical protein
MSGTAVSVADHPFSAIASAGTAPRASFHCERGLLAGVGKRPHIQGMTPDLTDEQAELLIAELDRIIENDRYPLSPRIQALREIRALFKPYQGRKPAPPLKHYEPPRVGARRRR